jgi:hypothetical protein
MDVALRVRGSGEPNASVEVAVDLNLERTLAAQLLHK